MRFNPASVSPLPASRIREHHEMNSYNWVINVIRIEMNMLRKSHFARSFTSMKSLFFFTTKNTQYERGTLSWRMKQWFIIVKNFSSFSRKLVLLFVDTRQDYVEHFHNFGSTIFRICNLLWRSLGWRVFGYSIHKYFHTWQPQGYLTKCRTCHNFHALKHNFHHISQIKPVEHTR